MKNFKFWGNRRGFSTVLFALSITLIMGLGALVADAGIVMYERQKLQNAIDAATMAAAQELPERNNAINVANQYLGANGVSPSDVTIDIPSSNETISMTANKTVNFFFARVLGINSKNVSIGSSAEIHRVGEPMFKYVLFSGSTDEGMTLNGSGVNIDGDTHTNKNFTANGSKITITGACEAVTTISVNGSQIEINDRVPNAEVVEMPDFSETIRLQAQAGGTYYTGNKTFDGSYLNLTTPIYVDGDVTITGSHFSGRGSIIATGSLIFNGSNLKDSQDAAICFYSKEGDVTINGSHAELDGIIYAPNGNITMNGSNQTIHGRVIGQALTFNGSGLTVAGGSQDLTSLPHEVKLVN